MGESLERDKKQMDLNTFVFKSICFYGHFINFILIFQLLKFNDQYETILYFAYSHGYHKFFT